MTWTLLSQRVISFPQIYTEFVYIHLYFQLVREKTMFFFSSRKSRSPLFVSRKLFSRHGFPATIDQPWKTKGKVQAIYRHRWIKRSSRASNVTPKVPYRVSRGFLDLLARPAPTDQVHVCFLSYLGKNSIDAPNFPRRRRERKTGGGASSHVVHLEGYCDECTSFSDPFRRFDGVASGVNGSPSIGPPLFIVTVYRARDFLENRMEIVCAPIPIRSSIEFRPFRSFLI